MEQRFEGRLDAQEQRLEARFAAQEQRFEGRFDAQEQGILERIGTMLHDTETRLLQAFYAFAESNAKRLNQIEGNVAICINRLGVLENRVLELENRLNIPPASSLHSRVAPKPSPHSARPM